MDRREELEKKRLKLAELRRARLERRDALMAPQPSRASVCALTARFIPSVNTIFVFALGRTRVSLFVTS